MSGIIIETSRETAKKLKHYLNEESATSKKVSGKNEAVFIEKDKKNIAEFIKKLREDPINVSRHINRMYPHVRTTKNINDLMDHNFSGKVVRIQAFPKKLEDELVDIMDKKGVTLHPKNFTHVLSVFSIDNEYYHSLHPKPCYYKTPEKKEVISRAYHKINESIERFRIPIKKDWNTLDLGAAPGGWSDYLSNKAKKVVAIDPAEMKIKKANITHLKKKFEESKEEVTNMGPYDLIACDANQNPIEVAENISKFTDTLKEEGHLLMTIKLIRKSKKENERAIVETEEILKREGFKDIKLIHLFANTPYEITIHAIKKK